MKYYLAPMEGVTGYLFRNAYHAHFSPMDRYFTPFIAPNMNRGLNTKELKDVLPEHNEGLELVPQILTNRADYFLICAEKLRALGYDEVNWNLGCPSGTVVAKKKGSGLLDRLDLLEPLLEEIADGTQRLGMKLSIKTRVGRSREEEWEPLLELYRRYPLSELIIHPRLQKDYYREPVRPALFDRAAQEWPGSLCYNGDLFTAQAVREARRRWPGVDALMLGRGVIANPGLLQEVRGEAPMTKEQLREFHCQLLEGYRKRMSGERPVLFAMKEIWAYQIQMFTNPAPYAKRIRKAAHLSEYQTAVADLFREQELAPGAGFQSAAM